MSGARKGELVSTGSPFAFRRSLHGARSIPSRTCYDRAMDRSSGYESVADEFLARRGCRRTRSSAIGVTQVRKWAKTLAPGSSVLDLGCGPGFPVTSVLVEEGLEVFAVDGSPSLVAAFRENLPGVPVLCEAVQTSRFFDRTFDSVLAVGLMFLLPADEQHRLIQRCDEILRPNGRLLFTSTAAPAVWKDIMTGRESVSLGAEEYRRLLADIGIAVIAEYEDEGENHYFDAVRGR
jgi:SAM-dependent methyltransferase